MYLLENFLLMESLGDFEYELLSILLRIFNFDNNRCEYRSSLKKKIYCEKVDKI